MSVGLFCLVLGGFGMVVELLAGTIVRWITGVQVENAALIRNHNRW